MMLTFEKVLEIIADYLAADETIEVYISRHGCVRVELTKGRRELTEDDVKEANTLCKRYLDRWKEELE